MGNVMVIPARRQVGNAARQNTKPKLRVAAYCRVSTDSDEQATSTINEMLGDKPGYQEQLQQNIAAAIRSASIETDDIDEKLIALQQELIQKANNKKSYDTVADEILRLRELKQRNAMDTTARDEKIHRINELQDFIRHSLPI